MQVVVEKLDNLVRKIKITVPAEQVQSQITERVKHLMKTMKMDGFRRGKIPEGLIRREYGKTIEFESLNEVLEKTLPQAFKQENLVPAGKPHIEFEAFQVGQPFSYVATFEVFPTIQLKPFNELVIEKTTLSITNDDIDQTLEGMRKQHIHWHEVDRSAQMGDRVWIKFKGTINGEAFAGGEGDNMPLVLGSKNTIAGFEEAILNQLKNTPFTAKLTFPENYGVENLAGKPVEFLIEINKIEAPELPMLDDHLAKHFGVEGGLEKLREEVKSTLENQCKQTLRQQIKQQVMDKLCEAYPEVSLPQNIVKEEAEELRQQMEQQFKKMQKSPQSLPPLQIELFMDRAKQRVLLGLVVGEIVKQFNLKPEAIKIRQLIEELAAGFDTPEKIIEWYYQDKNRLAKIEALALEEQVVETVLAQATVVEKIATAKDILRQQTGA